MANGGVLLAALSALPAERQRLALLILEALDEASEGSGLSAVEVQRIVHRMVGAGTLQRRRAPEARQELGRALGPSLADLDPVPYATVEQARRLAGLRAALLTEGALSTTAIARARGITANNARQWISRHRKAHRLFTVTHEGETLVPAFLLGETVEPRPAAREPIRLLREVGEDGWALWSWFAMPSAWLAGRAPADVLTEDPGLVAAAAAQRAATAA